MTRTIRTRFLASLLVLSVVQATRAADEVPASARASTPHATSTRHEILLNGEWQFRMDTQQEWKTVHVPSDFESHEGTDFDGIGWYRRMVSVPDMAEEQRLILTIQAAATETTVFLDGQSVGHHLGGWTPFECDLTDIVINRANAGKEPAKQMELLVRVDERVGHNSQGFLPVFAPHFGGLWQDVRLTQRSTTYVDHLQVAAFGNPENACVDLQIPLRSVDSASSRPDIIHVAIRERGQQNIPVSSEFRISADVQNDLQATGSARMDIHPALPAARLWTPDEPQLYDVDISLLAENRQLLDSITTRAAFRSLRVDGDRLLLNGQPLQVRGVLNWGYAPPQTSPSRDPEFWSNEIQLAKGYGFNLMKFCLWVPPKRYLELCDETGMLTWMEYPTWHSQWTPDQLPTLQKEFTEFFHYDRIHPCVILRSLTCETGPSADLNVIRSLYDLCHEKIPGSIVEDDSSWIEWNRVHDFYDDHPYGNNHTWPATLKRLNQHISGHGVKPLVLGEAIAADTWADPSALIGKTGTDRPFWLPGFLDANVEWMQKRSADMGAAATAQLQPDSLHYALEMRKYQIETYRREVPHGGYVVSVIRDFPFAGMGLLDYHGQPKWPTDAWSWHGDSTLLLRTDLDRRSFRHDEQLSGTLLLSHPGRALNNAVLSMTLTSLHEPTSSRAPKELLTQTRTITHYSEHTLQELCPIQFHLSDMIPAEITQPQQLVLRVSLEFPGQTEVRNHWTFWIMPPAKKHGQVILHESVPASLAEVIGPAVSTNSGVASGSDEIHVTSRLDADLLTRLQNAARVLMIPDGERGSFPLAQHWFLRGGPVIHPTLAPLHPMLVDLQHFDLAGPVIPDMQWMQEMKPLIMLWDNHDIRTVKTHALTLQTRVGKGRLLVSTLNHQGSTNAVGHWLLHHWLSELNADWSDVPEMAPDTVAAVRGKLVQRKMDLTDKSWSFRIDASNTGLEQKWHQRDLPEPDQWKPMSIGKHWEGLGYPSLDGWAWYRIDVPLPETWNGEPVYVCVEGADDHYEVYVNGQLKGTAGNIAEKKTAFDERSSFEVTDAVAGSPVIDGQRMVTIAFRVYDWYGAGGLFRPIFLSTTPITRSAEIIR